ncbi:MAG: aminopeptidase P family protein [Oscillospiraceae bacterium]|nr:aminopeptidase P family protein [Oscillospiraceae bacterium]
MQLLKKEADIRSIQEQYQVCDEILKERLDHLMPKLLKECGVDMWLVICREYNEDPVFKTLTPQLVKNASRTSCFIFSLDKNGTYEALSLSRPNPRLAPFYRQAYDPRTQDQYEAILKVVEDRNPNRVAVNISEDCAQADGLCKLLWDRLYACLGDRLAADGSIAIRWLETRTQRELDLYPEIYRISMDVLREAYSTDVITPGVTTTTDVEWFIMQRINDMGLDAWFSPDVDLQRRGGTDQRMSGVVIEKGDLLHTDMGLTYFGLYTDSQRLAYVLRDGETEIPAGLLAGFSKGNRFQDIVRENFKEGLTGNEIFSAAVEQAKREGIRPMLYSHPIGVYGHGAGPSMGMYDNQGFVPGHGELCLHPDTCYALELNITEPVPEWDGQDVCFMLEETIAYTEGSTRFMDGDRDKIAVIG